MLPPRVTANKCIKMDGDIFYVKDTLKWYQRAVAKLSITALPLFRQRAMRQ